MYYVLVISMLYDTIRTLGDMCYNQLGDDITVEVNGYGDLLYLEVTKPFFDVMVIVDGAVDESEVFDNVNDADCFAGEVLRELEDLYNQKKIDSYEVTMGEGYDCYNVKLDDSKDYDGFYIVDYFTADDVTVSEIVGERDREYESETVVK